MEYIFTRKYCWISEKLYRALEKVSAKMAEERNFEITPQQVSNQLATDIEEGRIIFDPKIIRFNNKDYIKFNELEKERIKKVNKNAFKTIQ
jgi:hypothetical protein